MPNYNAHIKLATATLQRFRHPVLEQNVGSFLIGCTAPDIRIINKGNREQYHFASLDFQEVGEGIEGLFQNQPELRDATALPQPAAAFICGCLSHIITDEVWITTMYRPYFGNPEVFRDTVSGNLTDRILQLEIDRKARERANGMQDARRLIEEARDEIDVGFIATEDLRLWRNWLLTALDKEFSWERIRFMARRISSGNNLQKAEEMCDHFLRSLPDSLEEIYCTVPEERVEEYMELAIAESTRVVKQYLS